MSMNKWMSVWAPKLGFASSKLHVALDRDLRMWRGLHPEELERHNLVLLGTRVADLDNPSVMLAITPPEVKEIPAAFGHGVMRIDYDDAWSKFRHTGDTTEMVDLLQMALRYALWQKAFLHALMYAALLLLALIAVVVFKVKWSVPNSTTELASAVLLAASAALLLLQYRCYRLTTFRALKFSSFFVLGASLALMFYPLWV